MGRRVLVGRPAADVLEDARLHRLGQFARDGEVHRQVLGVQPLQSRQQPGEAPADALGAGPVGVLVPVEPDERRVGLLRDQAAPGVPGGLVVLEGEVLRPVPLHEEVRDHGPVVQEAGERGAVVRVGVGAEVPVQGLVVEEERAVDHQGPAVDEGAAQFGRGGGDGAGRPPGCVRLLAALGEVRRQPLVVECLGDDGVVGQVREDELVPPAAGRFRCPLVRNTSLRLWLGVVVRTVLDGTGHAVAPLDSHRAHQAPLKVN